MQVISKASLGIVFGEESTLGVFKNSKSLSFIISFSAIISTYFSAHTLALERSTFQFLYYICWLEIFCAYTENFYHFYWCFAAFSASFCLLILQDSAIYWRYMLHITPGRLLSLPFLSLGNISPFLSCFSIDFWSFPSSFES